MHILSLVSRSRIAKKASTVAAPTTVPDDACHGSLDRAGISEPTNRLSRCELSTEETLQIKGWAAAKDPDVPFDALFFVIDDTLWLPVTYRLPRADTAALRLDGSLRHVGFDEHLPMRHIAIGKHTVTIVGRIESHFQAMTQKDAFTVLARPNVVDGIDAVQIERPGRVRTISDTTRAHRHDGRAAEAVRPGTSLFIGGWTLAADGVSVPDTTRVLLVSRERTYRVSTSPTMEPEAGVAFPDFAAFAGYRTWIDCTHIIPDIYELLVETSLCGVWTVASTHRLVEIMQADLPWLPAALPHYVKPVRVSFDVPLPEVLAQGASFLISGRLVHFEPILGVFVRFDREQTFALTTREDGQDPSATAFGCLCRPLLAIGDHFVEICALDRAGGGIYPLASTTLRVSAYPLAARTETSLASPTHFADASTYPIPGDREERNEFS
jgi:hypothetical protein